MYFIYVSICLNIQQCHHIQFSALPEGDNISVLIVLLFLHCSPEERRRVYQSNGARLSSIQMKVVNDTHGATVEC